MKKNIIFIFSDQQRWDTMGCYGQKLNVTPNLDKLAEKGTKFEYAYTCQPVCGPTRACIQTGKYATELGCFTNGRALPQNHKTIAEYFNENGYETAYIGKWHLASNDAINGRNLTTKAIPEQYRGGYKDYWIASDILEYTSHGYDGYMFDINNKKIEFKGYRADCLTDFALEYLNRKKENPFFMFLSFVEPHHQNDHNRYEGPIGSKEKFADFIVPKDLENTEGDWKESYPDYLGCCNAIDNNVGRILKNLEESGILDDTIIVYASDHGSHFKTRNNEYKRSCHENCTHVPLIISGGEFDSVGNINSLVSLIDVPSTLLAAANIEQGSDMQGIPLQEVVKKKQSRDAVFIQISESQVGRAIRTKEWKYSIEAIDKDPWKHDSSDEYTEMFLYNLNEDIHEQNNLIDDKTYEPIKKELRKKLIEFMVQAGETIPKINSNTM